MDVTTEVTANLSHTAVQNDPPATVETGEKKCVAPSVLHCGNQARVAEMALNHMLDRMGGMQIRMWNVLPNSEKKTTLHQAAREQGYKFIRDHGPRSNNSNQFMEWNDERVHLPGGKLEGWQEGKVKEAFNTCFRGIGRLP